MKTPVSNLSKESLKRDFQTEVRSSGGNSGVFARPDLKLFVLATILILVGQALIPVCQSESTKATRTWLAAKGGPVDIDQLQAEARKHPSVELFTLISEHYEKKGDYRRAIHYLRMADKAESIEDL